MHIVKRSPVSDYPTVKTNIWYGSRTKLYQALWWNRRLAIRQCYCLHVEETASLIIHHFRYLCMLINDDLIFMCTCIFFLNWVLYKICYMIHSSLNWRWQVGVIKRSWWSISWFVVIWIKQTVRRYQEVMKNNRTFI